MCGIVGYWEKTGEETCILGRTLLRMAEALGCRGPDSSGVALFGPEQPGRLVVRVKLGEGSGSSEQAAVMSRVVASYGGCDIRQEEAYLRFTIDESADLDSFVQAVESAAPAVEVVSLGRRLEIIKQVGSPANLDRTFQISRFRGTHGIGHTRLSTESAVDLSHSQPFWGHGYPDLAIVHNGHITNYHQLRRKFEQRGVRFYTGNDSEIVAIFLAGKLRQGMDLRGGLLAMIEELDGSFSCLVATATEFGFVKDPFSLKPLVFAETEQFVAVATEEIAIRSAIEGNFEVREAQAKEVRVWRR